MMHPFVKCLAQATILTLCTATLAHALEPYRVDGYASPTSPASMPFHAANEKNAFEAAGIALAFPPSAGADGTVLRLKGHQSNMTFWLFQAIRATATGSTRVCIIWSSFIRTDNAVIAKTATWDGMKSYVKSHPGAVHVVGGLDRPNTAIVESVVTKHALGTAQQNIDGSDETRGLYLVRTPNATMVDVGQPWVAGLSHIEGISQLENASTGLLKDTPTDGLAVLCDDLRPGSPEREMHKRVLRVVIKEARWLKDPANKSQVLAWIEANIAKRKMVEKIEANRGDRKVVWHTNDPLRELAEEVYEAAVPVIATKLSAHPEEAIRNVVRMVLGKKAPEDMSKFTDFSLAREILSELDGPAK